MIDWFCPRGESRDSFHECKCKNLTLDVTIEAVDAHL